MNSFRTRSTARKNILTVVFTCIAMMLLAFLGLKISPVTWLFFEGIVLLTMGFCLIITARTHWEIEFQENNILLLNTGNRQSFCLRNLRRSDLTIKQTRQQKARNSCDLKIADAPFGIYDVMQCDELRTYIQQKFPE